MTLAKNTGDWVLKGVYLLLIEVLQDVKLKIGALGELKFQKGEYVYAGSAQNNLNKRVERHLSNHKRMHWHIDYLLKDKRVEVKKVYYKKAGKKEECRMARFLNNTSIAFKNFGSSDCNCNSHFFRIENKNFIKKLGVGIL